MANYQDIGTCAADAAFRNRCLYATTVAAVAALQNVNTAPSVISYCQSVLAGNVNLNQLALTLITNGGIAGALTVASLPGATTSVSDAALQTAANTLLATLGGAQV